MDGAISHRLPISGSTARYHLASGRLCQSQLDIQRKQQSDGSDLFRRRRQADKTEQGFAKVAWQYDNRDNLVSESYFGIDSEPTLEPQGYASYNALYQGGNAVEYAYFGIDNRPTLSKAGIARLTRTYDSSRK